MRSSSAFNIYTDSPSASTKNWLNSHFWRFQSSSPYFDSRLSWLPNSWAYVDLYGIPLNSPLVAQHPEWILHDGSGKRLYIPWGCTGTECQNYAGDVTNSGFKSWWIARAKSIFAKGYKGFWIDDVNMEFRVSDGTGKQVAPYDPDTGTTMTFDNWRRYIAEFTEEIRAALPTAEIVHNAIWFASPTRYSDQYVIREIKAADYINCERGVSDPGLKAGSGDWSVRAFLKYVDTVHAYGNNVIFDEYNFNGDYGLAGYLLISNGGDAFGNQKVSPVSWWSGYDIDLGAPLGARYDWNGLIRRDFLAGMVLLNPAGAPTITVKLPVPLTAVGAAATVASVTLPGGQAAVLTGAAPIADFSVSATPATQTVTAGDSATYTVKVAEDAGFAGSVALAATGLPSGATASFSPAALTTGGSSQLKITTSISTPAGTYPITVVAASGGAKHTAAVSLTVDGISVDLSSSFNRNGITTDGTIYTNGGLDGHGFTYSANLFGKTQVVQGVQYNAGATNVSNVVSNTTIPLPAGQFAIVNVLGTGVNGNQGAQRFTVSYTDGTSSTFVQGMSNWLLPNNYSGEVPAAVMPYRNFCTGVKDNRPFYLYSYKFPVNKAKTVRSLTLPKNSDVVVLAVTVTP